ncbi:scarecrow-like protein 15 [Juglans microcarpa x Juglans regia]|uniref:scarecrow-like protein 15 n=1 Tax=Juglans microcarpa x Juglans regia TaxID=2249226 RepID=UPI001B7E5613|nr:scarecrow-like protein 15 [Juglans microcarpa x Juglans regia]
MRVTVNPPQTSQSPNPKPVPYNNTVRNIGFHGSVNTPNQLSYEPTSVLDIRRSPSPVIERPASTTESSALTDVLSRPEDPIIDQWEDHVLHTTLDWDSIIKELGLHDDPAPALKSTVLQFNPSEPYVPHLPELPQSHPFDPIHFVQSDFNLSEVYSTHNLAHSLNSVDLAQDFHHFGLNGFEIVEDLLRAADCFDTNQLQLAQAILERLNPRLRSPVGKPLQRAAFYFKEAFQTLLTTAGSNRTPRLSSWSEIVQTIRTYKAFSSISPIPLFSHFTTNQALLEALHGSNFIHVVDFDIGFGGQYASFMKEISERSAEPCKANNSPVLRITAVVPEEYAVESRLIKENLTQFAHELKIRLQVEFVLLRTFEMLSFKAIKFMEGEKTALLLSPTIFRRLGSTNSIAAFLSDLRRVSPSVVIFSDNEGWMEGPGVASFRRNFVNSLEFYSLMFESLDAAVGSGGCGGDWVKKVETVLLRPRIVAAVEAVGRRVPPWREVFCGAGMRAVQLSQFADFQAECLLGKVQVRGFHVAKRQAELVLCWHDRPMVATSAWRC